MKYFPKRWTDLRAKFLKEKRFGQKIFSETVDIPQDEIFNKKDDLNRKYFPKRWTYLRTKFLKKKTILQKMVFATEDRPQREIFNKEKNFGNAELYFENIFINLNFNELNVSHVDRKQGNNNALPFSHRLN